jgi:hypothetical protein
MDRVNDSRRLYRLIYKNNIIALLIFHKYRNESKGIWAFESRVTWA